MIKTIFIILILLVTAPLVQAQSFETCADLDGDGTLNIKDLIYWFEVFQGVRTLPADKGDIDFRQGHTLGDFRYISGFIFTGYPPGGCPPFDAYETQTTNDSIVFPILAVPTGDGTVSAPIAFINHSGVTDLLVPFLVTGLSTGVTLDSITSAFDDNTSFITVKSTDGDRGMFFLTAFQGSLPAGRRIIARAHFSYQASSGSTLILSDDDPGPAVKLSYVYANGSTSSYAGLEIGIPTMLVASEVPFFIPSMSAAPEMLEFEYTDGAADPPAQFIYIASDGEAIDWTAQLTSKYRASPRMGFSGDSISIQPRPSTFNFGTTYDTLEIRSTGSLNPLVVITLKMHVRPAYAAHDADCDGDFDLTDLIIMVNFLFRMGAEPCDPFSAEP